MLKSIFNSLLGGPSKSISKRVHIHDAVMPDNECAYVIGDIHGRVDLLSKILHVISEDSQKSACKKKFLIFLGDYIDRGPDSMRVIETIINTTIPGVTPVYLMGNHEESMLGFLSSPLVNADWLGFGGAETILSYGVSIAPGTFSSKILVQTAEALNEALPDSHREFLLNLKDSHISGDYMFVHAGINPERKLAKQQTRDLFWIRNEFVDHEGLYDKVIVHGHTIVDEPEFHDNRIAIDTGAYYSGKLTCLSLEGNERRIVRTAN